MKLVSLLLIIPSIVFCQDSAITYTEVVELPNNTQEQLFIKARQWLNQTIKSSKTALQIADKETGELTGKGYISSYYKTKPSLKEPNALLLYSVEFSIFVKDNKYKYVFTNFTEVNSVGEIEGFGLVTSSDSSTYKNSLMRKFRIQEIWREMKIGLENTMKELTDNLKEYMLKPDKTDF